MVETRKVTEISVFVFWSEIRSWGHLHNKMHKAGVLAVTLKMCSVFSVDACCTVRRSRSLGTAERRLCEIAVRLVIFI